MREGLSGEVHIAGIDLPAALRHDVLLPAAPVMESILVHLELAADLLPRIEGADPLSLSFPCAVQ